MLEQLMSSDFWITIGVLIGGVAVLSVVAWEWDSICRCWNWGQPQYTDEAKAKIRIKK